MAFCRFWLQAGSMDLAERAVKEREPKKLRKDRRFKALMGLILME
jgi:hypothetical protein